MQFGTSHTLREETGFRSQKRVKAVTKKPGTQAWFLLRQEENRTVGNPSAEGLEGKQKRGTALNSGRNGTTECGETTGKRNFTKRMSYQNSKAEEAAREYQLHSYFWAGFWFVQCVVCHLWDVHTQ